MLKTSRFLRVLSVLRGGEFGVLAVMLALAAFNLLIARPGLTRMAASGTAAAASELARRFSLAVRGRLRAVSLER